MKPGTSEPNPPDDVSALLDALLQAWRVRHQLDSLTADAIRLTIVQSPAAPPDEWWQQYVRYLDEVLRQANRASQDAADRCFKVLKRQLPWPSSTEGSFSARHDWRPYLALA
jgi:hypothetical protein